MEVDLIFKIAAIGIIVAVLNQLLIRAGREEYAMIMTMAGIVIALMMLIPQINSLFEYTREVFSIFICTF
ncbi:MAG: stage III sporulation protein AC [Acutalibacteraceae bacterium]|nr:stage III sporulation protein AC [Clostridiales bacterium]